MELWFRWIYTCTVDIIGMGSVIESLKLNVTDPERGGSNKSKSKPQNL